MLLGSSKSRGAIEQVSLDFGNSGASNYLSKTQAEFEVNNAFSTGSWSFFCWGKIDIGTLPNSIPLFEIVGATNTRRFQFGNAGAGQVALQLVDELGLIHTETVTSTFSDFANTWNAFLVSYDASGSTLYMDIARNNVGSIMSRSVVADSSNPRFRLTINSGASVTIGTSPFSTMTGKMYQVCFVNSYRPLSAFTIEGSGILEPKVFRNSITDLQNLLPINGNKDDLKLSNWTTIGTVNVSSDIPS